VELGHRLVEAPQLLERDAQLEVQVLVRLVYREPFLVRADRAVVPVAR
jgi:hypothetical protein